jgi:hypothetical protein
VRLLLALAAGVAAATVAWRLWRQPQPAAVEVQVGQPAPPGEEFSESERRSLEDVLRRKMQDARNGRDIPSRQ